MTISPAYLVLGVAIVAVFFFFLRRLQLLLRLAVALSKVAAVVLVIMVAGWAVGLWRLPRPMTQLLSGLPEPWEPVQRTVLEWFTGLFQ